VLVFSACARACVLSSRLADDRIGAQAETVHGVPQPLTSAGSASAPARFELVCMLERKVG